MRFSAAKAAPGIGRDAVVGREGRAPGEVAGNLLWSCGSQL